MRRFPHAGRAVTEDRQGILAATLVQPEKAWYVSELARRMGVPASSLQRELRDLSEVGILKTHRQGRMVYYQANTDSPVFSDLRGLMLKTAGFVDVLAQALKPLKARLRLAFVYGSIAAGGERSDSDIDLMVVGQVSPTDLALPLRRARGMLGRNINPTVYTPEEFDKKRAANNPFLKQVLDKPKLFVIPNKDELGKVARGNHVAALAPSKAELDNLRSIVARSLKDVTAAGLSADARFTMAYDAARTLSLIVRQAIVRVRSADTTTLFWRWKRRIRPLRACLPISMAAE